LNLEKVQEMCNNLPFVESQHYHQQLSTVSNNIVVNVNKYIQERVDHLLMVENKLEFSLPKTYLLKTMSDLDEFFQNVTKLINLKMLLSQITTFEEINYPCLVPFKNYFNSISKNMV